MKCMCMVYRLDMIEEVKIELGKLYALIPFQASDEDLKKERELEKDFTSFAPLHPVYYDSLALWDEVVVDSGKNRKGDMFLCEPFMILEIINEHQFYRIIQTVNGESKIGYIKIYTQPWNDRTAKYHGCLYGDAVKVK